MKPHILFILASLFGSNALLAQEVEVPDSLETRKGFFKKIYSYLETSNSVKEDKDFDISFIGDPHYSSETKLGLGLVASGVYRLDKEDLSPPPSNISLYSNVATSGFYTIGIEGNTIFPKDRYRINLEMYFASMPSRYWGVGYDKGRLKDNYTKYTKKELQFKADFLKKIAKNTFVGATVTAWHVRGSNMRDKSFLEEWDKQNNTSIGGGVLISYDSRDFIPNPYSGLYLKLEQNFYPEFLGSSHSYNKINFIARYYKWVWKGGILAFDMNGTLNNGSNVPWSMLAEAGGARQMRGYFKGRYRDKKLINTQLELRQKVYRRNGIVLWAGTGNIFKEFDDLKWKQTLPFMGLGYRWEFKNRVNIRLDYGIAKGQSGFYFNINEAF